MPVPVTAPAFSVSAVPAHKLVVLGVMLATVGSAFTVTLGEVTAAVLVQPVPGYVTVREYWPLAAVVVAVKTAELVAVVVL